MYSRSHVPARAVLVGVLVALGMGARAALSVRARPDEPQAASPVVTLSAARIQAADLTGYIKRSCGVSVAVQGTIAQRALSVFVDRLPLTSLVRGVAWALRASWASVPARPGCAAGFRIYQTADQLAIQGAAMESARRAREAILAAQRARYVSALEAALRAGRSGDPALQLLAGAGPDGAHLAADAGAQPLPPILGVPDLGSFYSSNLLDAAPVSSLSAAL